MRLKPQCWKQQVLTKCICILNPPSKPAELIETLAAALSSTALEIYAKIVGSGAEPGEVSNG